MAETGPLLEREMTANGSGPSGLVGRRVAGRRPSPHSRALVGGLLVAAAMVGFYAAYTGIDGGPGTAFVVAARDLAPGSRLAAADLTTEPVDLPPGVAARSFTDPARLLGATLVAPLAAGELVQASAVVAKPSGADHRELTFTVGADTLPASLEQGEHVDVLATYGTGGDAVTVAVARAVRLVGLGPGRGRFGEASATTLTVALERPDDALALAHALALAKLTVVRATGVAPFPAHLSFRQPPVAAGSRGP